jgi:hypothetical protein
MLFEVISLQNRWFFNEKVEKTGFFLRKTAKSLENTEKIRTFALNRSRHTSH